MHKMPNQQMATYRVSSGTELTVVQAAPPHNATTDRTSHHLQKLLYSRQTTTLIYGC